MSIRVTSEMIVQAVRRYFAEVERLKELESAVRDATGTVDPANTVASVGSASEIAEVGANEVGGAGTGAWIWVSTGFAMYPVAAWVATVVLSAAALSLVIGTVWAFHPFGPHASQKQIDAQYEIVNNPMHDQPQDFSEALGDGHKQVNPGSDANQSKSATPQTSPTTTNDEDYRLLAGIWGDCKREWHAPDQVIPADPGIINEPRPAMRVHSRAPWERFTSHAGVYWSDSAGDVDMRVSDKGLPEAGDSEACTEFMNPLFYCTKYSSIQFECHAGSNMYGNQALGEQYRARWDITGRTLTIHYHQPSNGEDDAGDAIITLTKKRDYLCPAPRNSCSQCFDAATQSQIPKPADCQ